VHFKDTDLSYYVLVRSYKVSEYFFYCALMICCLVAVKWLPNQVGLDGAGTATGAGIVGVVEADFLDPIHNKQEFDKTDRYK